VTYPSGTEFRVDTSIACRTNATHRKSFLRIFTCDNDVAVMHHEYNMKLILNLAALVYA